jgi:histidyl-tRNA synthetase
VHFNSRSLLAELLFKAEIPADKHSAVFLVLDKRGKIADEEIWKLLFENGLSEEQIRRTFELFAINTLAEAGAILGENSSPLIELKAFTRLMEDYGYGSGVIFDIGVVRGLGYYTGLVFEAFDKEKKFRAAFGGGRYNNLLQMVGGKNIPAVGLGFGDVVVGELMEVLLNKQVPHLKVDYAVGYMAEEQREVAIKVARILRGQGASVDMWLSPEKPKNFFARAGRGIAEKAIFIGPDEVARNEIHIKILATRKEECMQLPSD